MKVALVHDWLIHMRGGEKVLEAIAEIYPHATIYTLFYHRKKLSSRLANMEIRASFLNRIPGIRQIYRWLLPVLPFVIGTLKIDSDVDLVISSSHCVAKGIKIPAGARHLCYIHAPMRYAWGFSEEYFGSFPFFLRPLIRTLMWQLQIWDKKSNQHVDGFIANSQNVRQRIKDFYGREAEVIYPPLDAQFYRPGGERKDYYLVVSAFVPYKKVDLVIEAFNALDRKLFIIGSGPCESFYRQLRRSPQIFFLGPLERAELRRFYAEAKALIFPTDEDFGIVPLEAQACGTPVIAYGKGGALESVKTGIFFEEQTAEAIRKAIFEFEQMHFNQVQTSAQVASFDRSIFQERFSALVREQISKQKNYAAT